MAMQGFKSWKLSTGAVGLEPPKNFKGEWLNQRARQSRTATCGLHGACTHKYFRYH